jgi:hypothetical protein
VLDIGSREKERVPETRAGGGRKDRDPSGRLKKKRKKEEKYGHLILWCTM